jgi:hypothetical protein
MLPQSPFHSISPEVILDVLDDFSSRYRCSRHRFRGCYKEN